MSGILERIEAKIDSLTATLTAAGIDCSAVAQLADDTKSVAVTSDAAIVGTIAAAAVSAGSTINGAITGVITSGDASTGPYDGVDAEGVIWDKRIHSKAKEPKSATTGKWKRRKGIADELYNQILDELKSSAPAAPAITPDAEGKFYFINEATDISGILHSAEECLTVTASQEPIRIISKAEHDGLKSSIPAAPLAPVAPTTPVAPVAPAAPGAPAAPVAPVAPVAAPSAKAEVLQLIKTLESEYQVDSPDIERMVTETTGVDTLDKASEEGLVALKLKLDTWRGWLIDCTGTITEMQTIAAKHGHAENLAGGLTGLFMGHDETASDLALVPAEKLPELSQQLDDYATSWRALEQA